MQTTAAQLLAFRRELVEGGVNPTVADDMVRDASGALVPITGLTVRQDEAAEAKASTSPAGPTG